MSEKIAVVTGATSGIGRACAQIFAERGCRVVAVGRNAEVLASLASGSNGRILSRDADVTDTAAVGSLISGIGHDLGHIDTLINAAGIIQNGTIENTSLEDWDAMMNVNVRAVFNLMQQCVPLLEPVKGSIVNVSSVTGPRAFPNVLAYCVSKAAVDQLTRCAALDLASKGIRVNAVNPGVVVTNIHKRGGMADDAYDKFLEHSKTTHPLGRVGRPEEVAELIYYLASENASWITGATYEIDGGRAQTCAR
jgi:NAD(P)-dependent dehydrogenase (short-subunit alcohol dehydrogenase family)